MGDRLEWWEAAAHALRLEKATQRDQVHQRREQVRELRAQLGGLEARFAQTPGITAPKLKALQKAEGESSNAEAALSAMAAGLEVLASDAPVSIGEEALAVGEPPAPGP